ncbi:uncharacterized protein [Nicotiana tomentosiformis]|uniref:uncharacterized protein n=1 Tax=Nicotiana tomentosiformis TaxID=4098 RepID=UPI00388C8BB3
MDPLKYIFQKHMPTEKLAKWQILLSEFDIIYVTQKAVKGQELADHLEENPVDGEYEPLKTYFPDEEVSFVGEDITKAYDSWRMFFDGVANFKGVDIGAVLVSKMGQHYPVSAKLRFPCTNNMTEYEACILGLRLAIDMNVQELLVIEDSDLLVHQEMDGNPWFHDIKEYLAKKEYPEHANHTQKRTLRRLSSHFFQSRGILYRRTPYLGLLRHYSRRSRNPSLRIIQEAELSDAEWIQSRYEQLALIDGKRMNAVLKTGAKAKQEGESTDQPSPTKLTISLWMQAQ